MQPGAVGASRRARRRAAAADRARGDVEDSRRAKRRTLGRGHAGARRGAQGRGVGVRGWGGEGEDVVVERTRTPRRSSVYVFRRVGSRAYSMMFRAQVVKGLVPNVGTSRARSGTPPPRPFSAGVLTRLVPTTRHCATTPWSSRTTYASFVTGCQSLRQVSCVLSARIRGCSRRNTQRRASWCGSENLATSRRRIGAVFVPDVFEDTVASAHLVDVFDLSQYLQQYMVAVARRASL